MLKTTAAEATHSYEKKGFGSHVETFLFVPSGEPEWDTVILENGKAITATFVPGDSFSVRQQRWTTSFAVRKSALMPI